jgi:hypothetical protein
VDRTRYRKPRSNANINIVSHSHEQMGERLLTIEELEAVLIESNDPKYKIKNLRHAGGRPTTIQRISQNSGLILIKGNDDTGFDHIMVRHHPSSKGIQKLDDPSQFSLSTVPIYDLLHISDSVFKSENKILDHRNKNPTVFDLFIGPHTDNNGRTMNYKLFLYKDTFIIHNLIPTKRTFNKKNIINNLVQGFCGGTSYESRCLEIYRVPYHNSATIERAVVIIRLDTVTGIENWDVQINNGSGNPIFTHLVETRQVTKFVHFPFRIGSINYHEDMSKIEKSIKVLIEEYDKCHSAEQSDQK